MAKEWVLSGFRGFDRPLLGFLEELADNNNRPWFLENKWRYERDVRTPALAFIRAFQPPLKRISPFFVASDRTVGGSLMRVYRDTRFFKGSPYKTNVGIQFRHELGRDIHAPGFYVHTSPDQCFWRSASGGRMPRRSARSGWRLSTSPRRWRRVRDDKRFRGRFELEGGSLKRPPPGYPADHPYVDDLKRTDFLGLEGLAEQAVLDAGFLDSVAAAFAASRPFMRFLCDALKVPF